MAILISDVWHGAVIDFGWVSSRTIWVKLKYVSWYTVSQKVV